MTQTPDAIGRECFQHFVDGNYDGAMSSLMRLRELNASLPRVRLNAALVDYARSQYVETRVYHDVLMGVSTELKLTSEPSSNDGAHLILLYNYAVLSFHMGRYKLAQRLLQRILDCFVSNRLHDQKKAAVVFRENLLLLTELALIMGQPSKAHEFLTMIEDENRFPHCAVNKNDAKSVAMMEFFGRLQQAKIRVQLLIRDARVHKKDIKALSSFSDGKTAHSVFFKAMQEYHRGNYRKAIRCLTSIQPNELEGDSVIPASENIAALVQNALGCVYAATDRPHLARVYFLRSLEEYRNAALSLTRNSALPIYCYGNQVWRYGVLHNVAITLLQCGEALQAFEIFVQCVPMLFNNPRLWLRLAECCIASDHLPGKSGQFFQYLQRHVDVVREVVGMGPHRKLSFDFSQLSADKTPQENPAGAAMPVLGMQFASICLSNALFLLIDSNAIPPGSEAFEKFECVRGRAAPPGNLLTLKEAQLMHAAVLCAFAYVSMSLGDALTALDYSKQLLKHPYASNAQKVLAHLYAAEALIALNRSDEAATYLNPQNYSALVPPTQAENTAAGMEVPIVPQDIGFGKYPENPKSVAAIVAYNLALLHTMRGNYVRASDVLSQVDNRSQSVQVPVQAVLLSLFLQLQVGRLEMAIMFIKEQFPNVALRIPRGSI